MHLVVGSLVTIDGVVQAPGAPDEDRSGGFEHGGWMVPFFDDDLGQRMADWCARADALLLGRRTYEIFAAHWPHVADPSDPIADTFNRVPKHVASRTLQSTDWHNARLIDGDVADAVRELKRHGGGELQVHGSAGLVQTLLANDLVDEWRLWMAPVVLGHGKRLFGTWSVPAALTLTDSHVTSTGAQLLVYRRSGVVAHGSFALDPPTAEEVARRASIAVDRPAPHHGDDDDEAPEPPLPGFANPLPA